MKLNITAFLIGLILLAGCAKAPEKVAQKQPDPPKQSTEHVAIGSDFMAKANERLAKRDWWFQCAENVATKTGDKEALELVAFLKEHSIASAPDGNLARTIEEHEASDDQMFFFVALLPIDNSNLFLASKTQSNVVGASFSPETGMLVVRSDELSDDWAGVLLLHEVKHAHDIIRDGYDWTNHQIFCQRERDTHEFENRLVTKLGGKAYQKWLTNEVTDMEETCRQEKMLPGDWMLMGDTYPEEFETIFGPAKSDFERGVRLAHCYIDANFRLVEQNWKGDKAEQKAKLLSAIYEATGVLSEP